MQYKISQLDPTTSIGEDDLFEVINVYDDEMGYTGTNKKATASTVASQLIQYVSGSSITDRIETATFPGSKIENSTITSAQIADGTIVNTDISGSAAISLSKLATGALPSGITVDTSNIIDGSIVDADISGSAAISLSKLATGALPPAITVSRDNMIDGTSVKIQDAPPSSAFAGDLWYDSSSGVMSVYYDSQWIDTSRGALSSVINVENTDTVSLNWNSTTNTLSASTTSVLSYRNKLINGKMTIDQRNAGSPVTVNNIGTFTLDRWHVYNGGGVNTGVAVVERVTDAPTGFTHSLKYAVTTSKSVVASGDGFHLWQSIEGNAIADLAFGTPSAKTTTLSFWVKSSIAGNYNGCVRSYNGGPTHFGPGTTFRSYIFQYTINAANVWEKKTITIPGDIGGVPPLTDNSGAFLILFDLGSGSDREAATQNTWLAANSHRVPSAVRLINNAGAVWFITGVQFEVGASATPFDHRPEGAELLLCQRYFCKSYPLNTRVGAVSIDNGHINILSVANILPIGINFPTVMRVAPTITIYRPSTGDANVFENGAQGDPRTVSAIEYGDNGIGLVATSPNLVAGNVYQFHYTASAEF